MSPVEQLPQADPLVSGATNESDFLIEAPLFHCEQSNIEYFNRKGIWFENQG
jgi:hypothetical protein